MNKIQWGIIGCGDVTEVKSGPAFNKVKNSSLIAVMRRDEEKVRDYARRHQVPKWYTNAAELIDDPDVNAIYVATPPSSHEVYSVAALRAGKPVYVEKPMAQNLASARNISKAATETKGKLVVAHYRRAQPMFKKIKELLSEKKIGVPRFAKLDLYKKALSPEELEIPKNAWRVDPRVAGGGLFHDLAPHQLDLACYFFGNIDKAMGFAVNQGRLYEAADTIAGNIVFENNLLFSGTWSFNLGETNERDSFEIIGEKGEMSFSIFGTPRICVTSEGKSEVLVFEPLQHVQQPMIEKVVEYFLEEGPNPSSAEKGVTVMQLIENFTVEQDFPSAIYTKD